MNKREEETDIGRKLSLLRPIHVISTAVNKISNIKEHTHIERHTYTHTYSERHTHEERDTQKHTHTLRHTHTHRETRKHIHTHTHT